MSSHAQQTTLILPDLISYCRDFPLRINPHCEECSLGTDEWIMSCAALSPKRLLAAKGIKTGTLTSMAYPDAGLTELRLCSDFLHYLFHLDDLTDDMGIKNTKEVSDVVMDVFHRPGHYKESVERGQAPALVLLAYDIWNRVIANSGVGVQRRFSESVHSFLQALYDQSILRANGAISADLPSYTKLRRDEGGVWPAFILSEIVAGMELPDEVLDHPIVNDLRNRANDLICSANDLYSFNKEQARGDLNNHVTIVMRDQGLSMQEAFDYIGDFFKGTVEGFKVNKKKLPSWGPELDGNVARYVQGLEDWIVGNLHWSFASQRYFFDKGAQIKESRVLELLPRRERLQ